MTSQLPPLRLLRGASVCYRGRHHVIAQESGDIETLVLFDPESSLLVTAQIKELSVLPKQIEKSELDLSVISEEAWAKALKIYSIIEPLAFMRRRTIAQVRQRAESCGVGVSTIYKWLHDFDRIGKVSVFLRKTRIDKGKRGISPEAEAVIEAVIKKHYLSEQKLSPAKVAAKIDIECKLQGIEPPHPCTVRNRIKEISRYEKTKAREGRKAADEQTLLIKRHFDDAVVPLQLVQVDHTPLDISVVDDVHRLPIGRPWLTLLIDVCSRMVLGFCISLDPPGNLSLGLCLSQAFLPKDKWLHKHGIDSKWPCWGKPRTIHADNAKEFRGEMLTKACMEYGINMEWRPVATPRYGAHIERYLGTLNSAIHALPGTTFSNVIKKGEYEPEQKAVLTLSELEAWITDQITGIAAQSSWHEADFKIHGVLLQVFSRRHGTIFSASLARISI
jgi:putative transposase